MPSVKHWLPLLLLVACHRKELSVAVSQPEAAAPPPHPGAPPVVVADLSWAFWTRSGDLVAASRTHLYPVTPAACVASSPVAVSVSGIVAKNGLDRFVVRSGPSDDLWDAKSLSKITALAHHDRDFPGGAIDGAHIALTGCENTAARADHLDRCGELFDATSGARIGDFIATHDLERIDFSDDGKYLVGRSDDAGMTVFDAATGKMIVTRPHWKKRLDVHAWNRPDLAEIDGDSLIVGYDETIEHVDLTTGKSLGKIVVPGKTMATFGPKTGRVAVMSGADDRVTVWDARQHSVARKLDLHKYVTRGADCTHCALEFDDVDEDRVWLTSAYTSDRLELHVSSGGVERAEVHELRSDSARSATFRLQVGRDNEKREQTCAIMSPTGSRAVTALFCNLLDAHGYPWPSPGFSPDGRYLSAVGDGALHVMPVDGAACVTAK